MRNLIIWGCVVVSLLVPCASDMFMHFPPGSNNRLNGNQDNVRNAARLFDSQVTFGLEYINYWENDGTLFCATISTIAFR